MQHQHQHQHNQTISPSSPAAAALDASYGAGALASARGGGGAPRPPAETPNYTAHTDNLAVVPTPTPSAYSPSRAPSSAGRSPPQVFYGDASAASSPPSTAAGRGEGGGGGGIGIGGGGTPTRPRSGQGQIQMWDGSYLDLGGSFAVPGKKFPLTGAGSLTPVPSRSASRRLMSPMGSPDVESTTQNAHVHGDVPVADKSERRGFFAYDFGNGPLAAALIIFTPLLIVGQAQYQASTNHEFIEWREVSIDGSLCVNATAKRLNATSTFAPGAPYPQNSTTPFKRPEGYLETCQWFPVNKNVPGTGFDYTSLGVFALALTSIVTAVALIFLGALGDYGNMRRRMMFVCVVVYSALLAGVAPLADSKYWYVGQILGSLCAVVWNYAYRALHHGYIPLLVSADESLLALLARVNPSPPTGAEIESFTEALAGRITLTSSASFMTGQVLGLAMQSAIVLGVGSNPEDPEDTMGVRVAIFSGCLCCFILSFFGVCYLKDRIGPPLERGMVVQTLLLSARRSFATLDLARRELPEMFWFLAGRTAYWIAVNTLVYCGPLYLQREFGMQTAEIAPGLIVFMLTGIAAVMLFRVIVKGSQGRTRSCLRALTVGGLLIPIYLRVGMKARWEMYPLFFVAAFEVSPFAGLCRALLSEMTPDGYASTVMALEGTLEYCTTWIGPFIVAGIITITGSMRWAVFGMLLPMIIGLPMLWRVNMEKAREQRKKLELADARAEQVEIERNDHAAGTPLSPPNATPVNGAGSSKDPGDVNPAYPVVQARVVGKLAPLPPLLAAKNQPILQPIGTDAKYGISTPDAEQYNRASRELGVLPTRRSAPGKSKLAPVAQESASAAAKDDSSDSGDSIDYYEAMRLSIHTPRSPMEFMGDSADMDENTGRSA